MQRTAVCACPLMTTASGQWRGVLRHRRQPRRASSTPLTRTCENQRRQPVYCNASCASSSGCETVKSTLIDPRSVFFSCRIIIGTEAGTVEVFNTSTGWLLLVLWSPAAAMRTPCRLRPNKAQDSRFRSCLQRNASCCSRPAAARLPGDADQQPGGRVRNYWSSSNRPSVIGPAAGGLRAMLASSKRAEWAYISVGLDTQTR